ncbi:MAG: hypothetical protein IPL08_05300 [Saprospiraceae bacterium]|nr:hypothetical protein [Saprospiraceae bacterium]
MAITYSVYTVIYPINATGQTDVWIIQSNVVNSIESVITVSSANLGFYSTYLRLHNESTDLAYLLFGKQHPVYRANTAGLIRIVDTNLLLDLRSMTPSTKDEVIDDVNEKATCKKEGSSDKECKCAGGTGATSCECSGSIAGFSYHEQVSCS